MKISSKHRTGLWVGILSIPLCSVASAQVLESPQYYALPPISETSVNPFLNGTPLTLDAGEIDASVVTEIGNFPLNDIGIMAVVQEDEMVAGSGQGRIYSLIHTSGTDTRSLSLASFVDVPVNNATPAQCYDFPQSLHIMGLDGDDANDFAFLSSCTGFTAGPGGPVGTVYGLQGSATDPFQVPSSLNVLGAQTEGIFLPPNLISIGGQLTLTSGDFNNDGREDLVFYDADETIPSSQIHTLLNDGTIGALPAQVTNVTSPAVSSFPLFLVTSGDFNGDGNIDVAMTYPAPAGTPGLFAYSGDGDGTFDPAPILEVPISTDQILMSGLSSGDFDGNGFADFAVSFIDEANDIIGISIVLCQPGTPVACSASTLDTNSFLPSNLVTGDFNGDGLDDLANILIEDEDIYSVQIRLNNGTGFNSTPDQTLTLNAAGPETGFISQLVAKDIDACGGPDLAFTGFADATFQAAVAFNPNETPVADAGTATQTSTGLQVGGSPTCSDPTDDGMEISWTVISGTATLSDSSAANPIVTSASDGVVLRVTCTDACGLSASDTVTVPSTGVVQGSCGTSLTGAMSASFNPAWLMIPAAAACMGLLRRLRR